MMNSRITSLSIEDLDIEELEQRLEMALIPVHVRDDDDPPCGTYGGQGHPQPCGVYNPD
jgi:hypothetical protein